MIKAVIFDLDNVLIGAHEWHYLALNQALLKLYNYEISRFDHDHIYNGLPTKVKIKKLSEQGILLNPDIDKINKLKQDYTLALIEKYAKLDPVKLTLCNYLKNKNIVMCCYTNSIRLTATLMLQKIGIWNYISFLITNEQVINPKPHPEGYFFALKGLKESYQIDANETLIVEDSIPGIQAAQQTSAHLLKVSSYEEVNLELIKTTIEGLN